MGLRVAVAGASGFVGRRLVDRLLDDGYEVVAIARRGLPGAPPGAEVVEADIGDEDTVTSALAGVAAAYYLVHSMAGPDFRQRDEQLAAAFGRATDGAGVERIVYLGGLGDDPTSDHLVSRQEVGRALGAAGTTVVELRAAVILGAGSVSFEMLRSLTERLPFMVCPRWVRTRIQPVAEDDVVDSLVAALDAEPGVHEVGGPDVTTYRDMIQAYAHVRGLRRRLIVDVPLLTPRLSSYWVDLVSPVDQRVSHALIESLATEVVVRHPSPVGTGRLHLDDALRAALDRQDDVVAHTLFDRHDGAVDGVHVCRVEVDGADPAAVAAGLRDIGGDDRWYGGAWGWRVRRLAGRIAGERWRLHRPASHEVGAHVDWWTVAATGDGELVLRSDGWFPGDAWLGWRVRDGRLVQVGAFRPQGVPGLLYWWLLAPVHRRVFEQMARRRVEHLRVGARSASGQAAPTRRNRG